MSFGATPTFEHFVASEFNRLGPVVAIGRPGERLQPLGASRDYVDDPEWHRAVRTAIVEAALVVFVLGDSDSLLWEFRTTVETRGKRRALIIVPRSAIAPASLADGRDSPTHPQICSALDFRQSCQRDRSSRLASPATTR